MTIDPNNQRHIIADDDLFFHRIGSDEYKDVFGHEMFLGYSYYINGVKLEEPHWDVPEDFEEIPEPDWDKAPVEETEPQDSSIDE